MSTTGTLGIAAFIIASVTAYMAYIGMASGWQYYLTIEECVSHAPDLVDQRIRVSGKVKQGSLEIAPGRGRATFNICDAASELSVSCEGTIPDNLDEEMGVVVEGRLDEGGTLLGNRVLTRCASKYQSAPNLAVRSLPVRSAATNAEERRAR